MRNLSHRQSESGSVLLNIIIAVVMFVALTFGVVQSYRVGGSSPDDEKNATSAGQLTQYPPMVRAAIMRITAGAGSDTNISFDYAGWGNANYQHGPPLSDQYQVFHPLGGDIPWQKPAPDWLDTTKSGQPFYGRWVFTGSVCIPRIGTGESDACASDPENSDLMMILPYVRQGLCLEINKRLGVNKGNNNQPP